MTASRLGRIGLAFAALLLLLTAAGTPQTAPSPQAPQAPQAPRSPAAPRPAGGGGDIRAILPERDRARIQDEWLKWRLENILPEVMRREGIDMWLVIANESDPDPVYFTLLPAESLYVVRTSILIFWDRGPELGVARFSGGSGFGEWYPSIWTDRKTKSQFQNLAEFVKSKNPRRIGINTSAIWYYGDALTAGLKDKLTAALGPDYSKRLVSADRLCVGWLETRSPQELSVYRHICGIAHALLPDFFSNAVITPDVTTTEDVVWWIRQRIRNLGLDTWFHPSIEIIRSKKDSSLYKDHDIIRRGDLLHCDFGIRYLGLDTDMQWSAYVLRIGETDAPAGLKTALSRAVRLAEVFMGEFQAGRTGNEIVDAAMTKGAAEGLRPLIYSHPLGFYGHAAGPPMEARPLDQAPENSRLRGEYPLHLNTVYAIEFSATTAVPEWDNEDVRIGFEEDAAFTAAGCRFIDGHQTALLLIR